LEDDQSDENSDEDDEEYAHIKSEAVLEKEKRKALRKKYFTSLMVIYNYIFFMTLT
jgi:hypothetical protein